MPKIRASLRKLVYNLIERRRLGRIRIQAFVHITDYRVEAGYCYGCDFGCDCMPNKLGISSRSLPNKLGICVIELGINGGHAFPD
jgi:hypothetical protein